MIIIFGYHGPPEFEDMALKHFLHKYFNQKHKIRNYLLEKWSNNKKKMKREKKERRGNYRVHYFSSKGDKTNYLKVESSEPSVTSSNTADGEQKI